MENEKDIKPIEQRRAKEATNGEQNRMEPFNELSELSLEERMNVADQIGIPAETPGEAAATGTAIDRNDREGGLAAEEETGEQRDR